MTHLLPSARVMHIVDVALALWVAAWIGLGVAIGVNVSHLRTLSHTIGTDGRAVETVGSSLRSLGTVPIVGATIGRDAGQVQAAGASAVASSATTTSSISALSVLLAVAVALLPSVPVFGFYLPARLERLREAAALRRAARRHAGDPEFEAFLARRAVEALGYHRLREVSTTPWADIEEGRYTALAGAELRRLGLDPRLLSIAHGGRA